LLPVLCRYSIVFTVYAFTTQTLRRLAQNREAARKSRLRKKVSETTAMYTKKQTRIKTKRSQLTNRVAYF
jgi:hypothetical protein